MIKGYSVDMEMVEVNINKENCPFCDGTGWIKQVIEIEPIYQDDKIYRKQMEKKTAEVYTLCICRKEENER